MSQIWPPLAALVTLIVTAATVLPWFGATVWWIRMFDYPRAQVLALAVVNAIAWGFVPGVSPRARMTWIALAGLCAAIQAVVMVPYTWLHSPQVLDGEPDDDNEISLLVANVLMHNRDAAPLLALIDEHQPDIIAAIEADDWWLAQLSELTASHPHTVLVPQSNTYGMLVWSRRPLRDAKVEFLVEPDVPSIHGRVELRSDLEVDLYILHPKPPGPSHADDTKTRDAELLIVAKQVAQRARPAIVAGDLNDVAWSATTRLFQRTSGLLDPRIGRGLYNTFHAERWLLRWPLDHVFHSSEFTLLKLDRLGPIGSDHFPMFSRLVFTPEASAAHDAPEADAQDRRRANEKIAAPWQTDDAASDQPQPATDGTAP